MAIDLDADTRADAILREVCCGADWLAVQATDGPESRCEYTCWDSWWRSPEGWLLCAEGGPC